MTAWIALFRGINVGGANTVKMKTLAALIEALGARNVRTYIQSGNVVLTSKHRTADALASRIGTAVAGECGFRPHVMALTRGEIEAAASANPFLDVLDDPSRLHMFFFDRPPENPDLGGLEALRASGERFAILGRVLYLHAPDGVARSKLAAGVERVLGAPATARNWRTVGKLIEMARSAG